MLLLFLLLLMLPAEHATSWQSDDEPARRTLTAHPVTGVIHVDGVLDEADWQQAPVASDFRQFEPHEGAPATLPTEVRILYGPDALYVGALLHDPEPDLILRTLGRRDEFNQADWFIVSIDSYLDRKTAYTFGINAAGVLLDGVMTRDLDPSWDAIWEGHARVTAEGWVVEMRIPYAMLRFPATEQQTWGINFQRMAPRLGEVSEWALVRRSERGSGVVAHYGMLEGLRGIRPKRNLQLIPYSLSRLQIEEDDLRPGHGLTERELDVGADLKIGLSSSLVLDATLNPDFGQVEADPAELNLTAFETFFPERRPFFIEGAELFNFSYGREGNLLYTRRIGARAPIIGATKLTGRTPSGLSVGLLAVTTGENFSPEHHYGVVRLRQQFGTISSAGTMLTAYDHTTGTDSPRRTLAGGLDWDVRLKDNVYQFRGQTSLTHRTEPGLADGITETGLSLISAFERTRGTWTYNLGFDLFDDRFNPNDMGRLRRNNFYRLLAGVRYQINDSRPFGPFQRASLRLFSWKRWTYANGEDQEAGFFLFSDWETNAFQRIELRFSGDFLFGGYDPYETRGLGSWAPPRQLGVNFEYATDSRRAWQLSPELGAEFTEDGGRDLQAALDAEWNAGSRLRLEAGVSLRRSDNRTAWVANETFLRASDGWAIGTETGPPDDLSSEQFAPLPVSLDEALAGYAPYEGFEDRFYVPVFGRRDTRSADLTLRSTVTFTPNLTLQFYGQLFVARGRYDDFHLLADRDTLVPVSPFPKRYDFSVRSFQTNLVLRWEYRPGSTVFLVWSQARRGTTDIDPLDLTGRSPFERDTFGLVGDTFDLFPTNVFILKISYTFMP